MLSVRPILCSTVDDPHRSDIGIAADDADKPIKFTSSALYQHGGLLASSVSSLEAGSLFGGNVDPFDFSPYMDQAPLTVQSNSPLELVQQFFAKLGARYVVVTDADGYCTCYFDFSFTLRCSFCMQMKGSLIRRHGLPSCHSWRREKDIDQHMTTAHS